MTRKNLFNQLELAHAPLTAYEFAVIKDDPEFEAALHRASLYVLGQRPVITFENIIFDPKAYKLNFQIHQQGNPDVLDCKVPLIQKVAGSNYWDEITVAFNFVDKLIEQHHEPYSNVRGFSFAQKIGDKFKFLMWLSPEKLLKNRWNEDIECEIDGNIRSFTKYKVHYVGKATKQNIVKRLTGHSTLQDILSLESPVTVKQLPANEIVILPFQFRENLQIQSFGENSDVNKMVAAFRGDDYPSQEKIFLDAEKALIKAMQPKYNKQLFNAYPISKDGLYSDNYDVISYTFIDPITLFYGRGDIAGGLTSMGGDAIHILNNKEFTLFKHKN